MTPQAATLLTRDEVVQQEGSLARHIGRPRHDNPYRPGSVDWQSWNCGFAEDETPAGAAENNPAIQHSLSGPGSAIRR